MKFLADENIDQQIVQVLRDRGHEVLYVAEMERGVDDDFLSDLTNKEGAVLVTADKDFGEIVFRQGRVLHGVVLLRLYGIGSLEKASIVAAAVDEHALELPRSFTVISPATIRIRRAWG